MTPLVTFGLISGSAMVVIVIRLLSILKPTTVNVTLYQAVPKSSFLIAQKTLKHSLVETEAGKLPLALLASHTSVRDSTLNGTTDISGFVRLLGVFSPMISLKGSKLLLKPSSSGSPSLPSFKYGGIIKEQK